MRKCEICSSIYRIARFKKQGAYLCGRHYEQIRRYGKILPRTRFDPNEIISCASYYEIILYNNKHTEVARSKISKRHIERIKQHKWSLQNQKLAITKINRKTILLHTLIFGKKKGFEIDHINHDTLDNRDENLRFVTHTQNMWNLKPFRTNKSGTKGVWWDKTRNRWQVGIKMHGKHLSLGYYKTYEEAVKARLAGERKYHGQYAYKHVA